MNPRHAISTEVVESGVVALVAVALFAVTYTFEEVPPVLAQGIGPAIFPRVVLLFMFGLALLQGYQAWRKSALEEGARKQSKPIPRIVYLTGGLLILFVIGMNFLGTIFTIVLFCFALALLWGERRWHLMIPSFAGFTAFIYALFVYLLGSNLP